MPIAKQRLLTALLALCLILAGAVERQGAAQPAPTPQGPEHTIAGVALTPDGKRAAGAEVVLCPAGKFGIYQFVGNLDQGQMAEVYKQGSQIVTTGPDGKFSFKTQAKYFGLVVRNESGVAIENEETLPQNGQVRLHGWGRVEGVLKDGSKVVPNRMVQIDFEAPRQGMMTAGRLSEIPHVTYNYTVTTDAQGRYVFERIHSGPARIGARVDLEGGAFTFSPRLPLEIKPVGTTTFNLGGTGRLVTGKVALKEGSDSGFKVADCRLWLHPFMPQPPEAVRAGRVSFQKWQAEWEQTPEGKAYKALEFYGRSLNPDTDGSFSISDLPAGKFQLRIEAHEMRELKLPPGAVSAMRRMPGSLLGTTTKEFEVPPMQDGRTDEPLDLGRLEVLAAKVPKAGNAAPDFTCVTPDGKEISLKDTRGKTVLLDFWATWCGPCREETPALKAVWAKYGKRPDFAMISLSLDNDMAALEKYIKENGLGWTQGYLGKWANDKVTKAYGVQGIPAIMLIGPDGRIVEKDLRGEGIAAAVEKALPAKK